MFVSRITKDTEKKLDLFFHNSNNVYLEQSFSWISFQKELDSRKDAEVLVVLEKENDFDTILLSAAFSVIRTIFGKTYIHVNRGPVFSAKLIQSQEKSDQALNLLIEELKEIGNKYHAIFERFDFPFEKSASIDFLDAILSATKSAHTSFQPGTTLFLDLTKSAEELLAEMHPKGRYNIKIAQKKAVKIRISNELNDLKCFYNLLNETAKRDGFSIHDLEYYEKMFKNLSANKFLKLYIAEYEGKIIAANLISFFQDKATYYYGASKSEYRNVMAPYLLQWQAILDAKNAGFRSYDFLGISGKENEKSSWAGITSFKKKFGGFEVTYLPAREKILNFPFYYLLIILKKIRTLFC